jgi:hypothetical protein
MWYSILARSVRNDFLFPSWLLIVGIVIQLAEAVLATLLRSFFVTESVTYNLIVQGFSLHNKNKEIFTGLNLVGVSFFDAEKSGRRSSMKSVRDPPEKARCKQS